MSTVFTENFRGARAAILCYAVTDPDSWERLQFWVSLALFIKGVSTSTDGVFSLTGERAASSGGEMSTVRGSDKAWPARWTEEEAGLAFNLFRNQQMTSIYVLQVDYHNTTDFCDANDAKLFETSSKQNDGIEELFATIVDDYVADVKKNPSILVQQAENKISGTGWGKKEKKKACCASS